MYITSHNSQYCLSSLPQKILKEAYTYDSRRKTTEGSYLCQRPGPALDVELCVAKLTVASVGGRQPPLQAALVHRTQGACAVTG